jgi:hypothetical protein
VNADIARIKFQIEKHREKWCRYVRLLSRSAGSEHRPMLLVLAKQCLEEGQDLRRTLLDTIQQSQSSDPS